VETEPFFSQLSLWQLFALTLCASALALEAGYRLGKKRRAHQQVEKDAPVSSSVGATLGLLAFMLAMTFGVAMSQFDIRRQAFIDEVDAVSTAYLRADFLPLDLRDKSKQALREYITVHLQAADTGNLQQADNRSKQIHTELWNHINTAKDKVTDPLLFSLYIESINQVMDVHTRRIVAAIQLRIPTIIWIVLYGVALVGMTEMGYQTGITASTRSPAFIGLIVSFAAVLWLIADLDRPREGAISISQAVMREMVTNMSKEAP
jgi:hypothetical protein